jgi:hypothetical protein
LSEDFEGEKSTDSATTVTSEEAAAALAVPMWTTAKVFEGADLQRINISPRASTDASAASASAVEVKLPSEGSKKMASSKRELCRCKNSHCLKLYCICFSAGTMCLEGCKCVDCHNGTYHQEERSLALQKVSTSKKLKVGGKTCHCVKSNCLKK